MQLELPVTQIASNSATPPISLTPVSTGLVEEPSSKDVEASPPATPVLEDPHHVGKSRKLVILAFLCSAQFLDIFNATSIIITLPRISDDLYFTASAFRWVITAYTLTFTASLLFAGRLSNIYHPKAVFCVEYLMVGIMNILCGISIQPNYAPGLPIHPRHWSGVDIPFSFGHDCINRAFAIFGALGAVGNVFGFILGGVLAAKANWRWIFSLLLLSLHLSQSYHFLLYRRLLVLPEFQGNIVNWTSKELAALGGGLIFFVHTISDGNEITIKVSIGSSTVWRSNSLRSSKTCGLEGISTHLASGLVSYLSNKVLLSGGQMMVVSVVLYALADTPDK
ncbi:hypothetical protein M422DRAFT_64954 [Sphaerobolus stellatus SS14]|nr:hypothetical protein M422DRAFT_64954 [Sphaerobolus stellatus SS14]